MKTTTIFFSAALFLCVFLISGCNNGKKAKIAELEQKLLQAETENSKLTNQNKVLTQEKESLQVKINDINTKVDEVTKACETLRTETVKMKEELTKQRDEAIDSLQTTNKALEELKNNWDQQTQRNNELEQAVKKMQEIIDTVRQNVNTQ